MNKQNSKAARSTSPQVRQIAQLATVWNAMSGIEKSTWAALAGQLNKPNVIDMPAKIGPYQLFIRQNIALWNASGTVITTAPANPGPPVPFGLLTLMASYGPGGLSLTLNSSAAYPDKVTIYAARPLLAGMNRYSKTSFHAVGSLNGLSSGPNSLTSIYENKYHVPSPGYEIALELTGVTPGGFHTARYLVTAIALAPGAIASGSGDREMPRAA